MKVANHAIKTYLRKNEKDNTSTTVKGQIHSHHGRNLEPKLGCTVLRNLQMLFLSLSQQITPV